MSKAVAKAAVLKPEIRLVQAISEFEAHLSGPQKDVFKQEKQVTPKAGDVMRLTAQIDKTMSARGVRRVHGPLMTNFLDGVQMFIPLGDNLIGGTSGMLGRGIWTVVRFSIITTFGSANHQSSYADKLSSIFMEAGRSAPRYQNMALLFPQSKKLQVYLTEYFIVVVKLCHKILKTSQNSGITQWWDSLSDPLQGFQSQLKSWSTAIKDEVLIQSVVMAQEEKEEASRLRIALQRDRKEKELKRKQKLRNQFLDQCSQYDHIETWKQIRKTGNTKLFVNHPEYIEWRSGTQSRTLVYCGKLGAGKSVLLSNIVADLHLELKSGGCCITYFFCTPQSKESLQARTILRCFARQLLQVYGDLDRIADLDRSPTTQAYWIPDVPHLLDSDFSKPIYLILDGLDECDAEQRDLVLTSITTLQQKLKLSLCISSRLEPDRTSKIKPQQLVSPKFLDIPEDNPDIADFIDYEIKERMSSGQLRITNEEIIPTIKEVLMLGSQGMFLWVSLSIKSLFNLPSDDKILEALADLPPKLNDTYIGILDKIPDTHKTSICLVLRLIFVAVRPLSTHELRVALNVEPSSMQWNALTLINDMSTFLACSGGLIIVDEESLTARFVHHSFGQLLADSSNTNPYCFSLEVAERDMAQILATYLNYLCFDTRISTAVAPKIDGVPIVDNVLGATGTIGRLFKRTHKGIDRDIGKILAETAHRAKNQLQTDLSLEDYARTFWCQHSCSVLDTDSLTLKLASQLVQKSFKFTLDHSLTSDPLAWTIENGYSEAFGFLMNSDSSFDYSVLAQELCDAAARGDVRVIEKYVERAANVTFANIRHQFTLGEYSLSYWIFQSAVVNGQIETAKLLLDQKDIDEDVHSFAAQYIFDATSRLGVRRQDFEIFKLLVNSKKIKLSGLNNLDEAYADTVQRALRMGQIDLAELLLEDSSLCSQMSSVDRYACLSVACKHGYTEVVELLLKFNYATWKHVDIGMQNTPLHLAVQQGHMAIVSLLLDAQVLDYQGQNDSGETPLILACKHGHLEIVRMFLSRYYGYRLSLIGVLDHSGRTPLSWAAGNGHMDVVRSLADPSALSYSLGPQWRCNQGRSPLSYAAESGSLEMVEFLLRLLKHNWDEVDKYGFTPCHYSRDEAVRSLLSRTMSDGLRDGYGADIASDASISLPNFWHKWTSDSLNSGYSEDI